MGMNCKNCIDRTVNCHLFCDDYKKARFVNIIMSKLQKESKVIDYLEIERKNKYRLLWQKRIKRGK